MKRTLLFSLSLSLAFPGLAVAAAPDDPMVTILSDVERDGMAEVWRHAQELVELGLEHSGSLRGKLLEAPPLSRLAISRALLELEEVPDARDGLLGLVEADGEDGIRLAAVQLLGDRSFDDDSQVIEKLRALLDQTFEPRLQLAVAKSLYEISRSDRVMCTQRIEQWLKSDRRDLRVMGALTLAELGNFERAHRVLAEIAHDPTPEGALARAYRAVEQSQDALYSELRSRSQPLILDDRALVLFREVYDLALRGHIRGADFEDPEDREKLVAAAANGMLSYLDEHSTFFTNDQHVEWNLELSRDYGGIGAYVDILNQIFTITRPIYGYSAYKAGLRSGDQILGVDGWSTEGVTNIDEIIQKLKGPPGTSVKIAVYRSGWEEPRDFTLSRDRIVIPSVSTELLPGNIGYLEVMTFGRETTREVVDALQSLARDRVDALIVDLRYNSGGFLDTAVDLVGIFCGGDQKLVVTTRGTAPEQDRQVTRPLLHGFEDPGTLPVAVLINRFSASASEILAGNLHFYERATLVGEHTYGKGSVQTQYALQSEPPEEFSDKNGNGVYDPGEPYEDANQSGEWDPGPFVKLTTALYYLPDGTCIDRRYDVDGKLVDEGGLEPDLRVEFKDRLAEHTAEVARLLEELDEKQHNVFERYVDQHYADHQELFVTLAEGDAFDCTRYPGFEEFYGSLNTDLDRDQVRFLLRITLRKKVSDEMVRQRVFPFPGSFVLGDYQEDPQLQAAIQAVLKDLGRRPSDHPEYGFFDGVDLTTRAKEKEKES